MSRFKTEEIDGFVKGTGRYGDCPTLEIVLKPVGDIEHAESDIKLFTWTIGERVKVVRE